MKIAVIGPGAMGLLFGSYLSQHHDVTLVGTNPAKMQSITENGVTIRETDGSERIYRPHAIADTTGLSPVDLVIVQVKASASEAALTKNKALIGPDTILMTLQNGMGHETLLSRFAAREQIVIGTTQQGSYKLGETAVCHSGLGKTFLGAVTGDSSRFAPLAEMFAGCGFPCEVCSQVQGMIWDKLMINASSSVLSGILQVAQGYVEQDSHAWTLTEKLICELCAAATADGYPFDAEEQIARIRLHLQKAPDGFTSIYADLKAGRRTEVDVINGAVVEAGHRHNIPVPTHEFVVELVHAMEGRA